MAINWTTAQAYKAIKDGNKEAIQDIGRRFPLFLAAVAGNDMATIMGAIPEHITARKIEAILKDGIEESTEAEDTDDTDVEEPKAEKPAKKERKPRKAKKEEVEDETEDDAKDPVALYKECKKAGLKVKPRQSAEYYLKELAKLNEADEEEPWDDEEEEEAPKPKKEKKAAPKKAEKKPAKKAEPEPEEDEDDDDDWDI